MEDNKHSPSWVAKQLHLGLVIFVAGSGSPQALTVEELCSLLPEGDAERDSPPVAPSLSINDRGSPHEITPLAKFSYCESPSHI